jgi:hypothetical protein
MKNKEAENVLPEASRPTERFGHANEASIGEAHWDVRIFLDQLHDWLYILGNREATSNTRRRRGRRDWEHRAAREDEKPPTERLRTWTKAEAPRTPVPPPTRGERLGC